MISILLVGLAIALAAYFVSAKNRGGDSRKAKKQEKGEIIRQLLALSERENIAAIPSSVQSRTRFANKTMQPGTRDTNRSGFVSSSRKS